jgi:DNA-binding CsgD family transcriptional regulator
VETHRAAIHRKLDTSSRAEVVAFAREHGLIEDQQPG